MMARPRNPAQVEPWPVVDILDDGRVVARRVARGFTGAGSLVKSQNQPPNTL